ncbi:MULTISPECIES: Fur-regulated basic protein FbpA [Bacillaceae]|uniref:Fur-regulated basic protein FbpA n=1 Tax=Ectobacillus funiculus TaxID=137993 RepID=A0ABV5WFV4_9BACI|nr:Fur-regulated basic protein FbpA [Ectobacillus funiculus]
MNNLLRYAIEQRKQYLIDQLIASGLYTKESTYLFRWTLSDLEQEYTFVKCMKK